MLIVKKQHGVTNVMNAVRFAWIDGILGLSNFGEGMDGEQKCEYIEREMCKAFPGVVTNLKASLFVFPLVSLWFSLISY
jgi:hypothetical protein